jgi:hypothetical protein
LGAEELICCKNGERFVEVSCLENTAGMLMWKKYFKNQTFVTTTEIIEHLFKMVALTRIVVWIEQ